jgi:hypothetical protein
MSTLECILLAAACLCIGAGITNAIWVGIHRRYVFSSHERFQRECKYGDRMLQHVRNMGKIAESAMGTNDAYRDLLVGKIIIDDPSAPPSKKRGQA